MYQEFFAFLILRLLLSILISKKEFNILLKDEKISKNNIEKLLGLLEILYKFLSPVSDQSAFAMVAECQRRTSLHFHS